jgi:hypothetical protein
MSSSRIHPGFGLIVLSLAFTTVAQPAQAADGTKFALLVGVDKYEEGSGFRPLAYTQHDVDHLAQVLLTSGYRPDNMRVLTMINGAKDTRLWPSARNIRREIELLAKNRKPTDSLVVALSGHGVRRNVKTRLPGGGEKTESAPFFCPIDADIADPESLVSITSIYETLKESPAGVKVMFVDACQNDPTEGKSGAIPFAPAQPPATVAALFACSAGEVAWDARELGGGRGVFFHYVIEGLKGAADADHDKHVTLAELASYTQESVPEYVRRKKSKIQMPSLRWDGGKITLLDLSPSSSRSGGTTTKVVEKASNDKGNDADVEKAPAKNMLSSKTTVDGVEYFVSSSTLEGDLWLMTLTAKSLRTDHTVRFMNARAIRRGGKTIDLRNIRVLGGEGVGGGGLGGVGGARGGTLLPKGLQIEIPFQMGKVPDDVKLFPVLELYPAGMGFGGNSKPIALKNVQIQAPAEEAGAADETALSPPTTYNGVVYRVSETSVQGDSWTMTLTARSLNSDQSIHFRGGRIVTEQGKTIAFQNNPRRTGGAGLSGARGEGNTRLPKGVEIQITINMGTLPEGAKQFPRIELYPSGPGFGGNASPLVLKNVKLGE